MITLKSNSAIGLAVLSFTISVAPSSAIANHTRDPSGIYFVQQPELPDNGTPTGRPKGAAGRGNCTFNTPLTALVPTITKTDPKNGIKTTYVWAKTSVDYPTFWFYVPYSLPSLQLVEFVLQDGENDVYRTFVTPPEKPGTINISLPSTVEPLKIGKMYRWFLKLKVDCTPQEPVAVKEYVEGWIQRVQLDPDLAHQLETATLRERLALYIANSIWYEALTSAANLINAEDRTHKQDWVNLLHSVGLDELADQPILQCCTSQINSQFTVQNSQL